MKNCRASRKRLVSGGLADLVKIVMLAASAKAFLRRNGSRVVAFFVAQKNVFELIHPGVDKKERRVVRRKQRRGRHDLVTTPFEVVKKFLSDLVACHRQNLNIRRYTTPILSAMSTLLNKTRNFVVEC
jgi:hypothetical protein